jgi:hypothetical protein
VAHVQADRWPAEADGRLGGSALAQQVQVRRGHEGEEGRCPPKEALGGKYVEDVGSNRKVAEFVLRPKSLGEEGGSCWTECVSAREICVNVNYLCICECPFLPSVSLDQTFHSSPGRGRRPPRTRPVSVCSNSSPPKRTGTSEPCRGTRRTKASSHPHIESCDCTVFEFQIACSFTCMIHTCKAHRPVLPRGG